MLDSRFHLLDPVASMESIAAKVVAAMDLSHAQDDSGKVEGLGFRV